MAMLLYLLSTWIITECHHFIFSSPLPNLHDHSAVDMTTAWPGTTSISQVIFWLCKANSQVEINSLKTPTSTEAGICLLQLLSRALHLLSIKEELQHFLPSAGNRVSRWDLAAGILAVPKDKKRIQGQGEKEKVKRKAREETGVQIRN